MCSTSCSNYFLSMKKTMKKTIHERVVLELGTSHSTAPPAALHRALVALQRTGFTLTSVKPAKAHQFHFCGRVEINLPVYGLIPIYGKKGFSFENSKVSKAFIFKTHGAILALIFHEKSSCLAYTLDTKTAYASVDYIRLAYHHYVRRPNHTNLLTKGLLILSFSWG